MRGDIVGIDLGTTFSAVGIINGTRKPIIVPNSQGEKTTPSVVKFEQNGDIEVGKHALRSAISSPDRVVQKVKREMGSDWRAKIDGSEYSPEEISASILNKLKSFVESKKNTTVNKALITVPAYFKDAERKATRNAGEIAGFEEEILIEEPIAGFLSEFLEKDVKNGFYFVSDMGGGTHDTTVLKVDGSDIDVVSIEGEKKLGGQDFTQRIVEWLEGKLGEFQDPRIKQDVFNEAEFAKRKLSNSQETTINITLESGPKSVTLTRDKFEELIEDLIEKAMGNCEKAVSESPTNWGEIREILLIGGSSRIPVIKQSIEDISGIEPRLSSKPDLAVATGATIKAASEEDITLYNDRGGVLEPFWVNEMLSHSLGVETVDLDTGKKKNSVVLKKGKELPAEGEAEFSTQFENQTNIKVKVLEGDSKKVKNCDVIGNKDGYKIEGIPPMAQGVPSIIITMEVNDEGILKLKAKEQDSGKTLETEIKREELIGEKEKKQAQKRVNNS